VFIEDLLILLNLMGYFSIGFSAKIFVQSYWQAPPFLIELSMYSSRSFLPKYTLTLYPIYDISCQFDLLDPNWIVFNRFEAYNEFNFKFA
jgi:hypothetical protein